MPPPSAGSQQIPGPRRGPSCARAPHALRSGGPRGCDKPGSCLESTFAALPFTVAGIVSHQHVAEHFRVAVVHGVCGHAAHVIPHPAPAAAAECRTERRVEEAQLRHAGQHARLQERVSIAETCSHGGHLIPQRHEAGEDRRGGRGCGGRPAGQPLRPASRRPRDALPPPGDSRWLAKMRLLEPIIDTSGKARPVTLVCTHGHGRAAAGRPGPQALRTTLRGSDAPYAAR